MRWRRPSASPRGPAPSSTRRVRSARNELTAYAADLAVELARELVVKNVTPDDEKRLVAEGVKSLAGEAR